MEKFNINEIVERLSPEEAAQLPKVLFPDVKFPKLAFSRILKGEAHLDTCQVAKLAELLGVPVSDLFRSSGSWRGGSEDGCITLSRGRYRAKLNYGGVYLTLYKDGEVIRQVLSNVPGMTVQEFTEYLNQLINEHEHGNTENHSGAASGCCGSVGEGAELLCGPGGFCENGGGTSCPDNENR